MRQYTVKVKACEGRLCPFRSYFFYADGDGDGIHCNKFRGDPKVIDKKDFVDGFPKWCPLEEMIIGGD